MIDSRWLTLPLGTILAYMYGDVSGWVILLVWIGSLKIDIIYK